MTFQPRFALLLYFAFVSSSCREEEEVSKVQFAPSAQTLIEEAQTHEKVQRYKEAEDCYLRALALGEENRNSPVVAECLFSLTALIGPEEIAGEPNLRIAEALPYYFRFWENHSDDSRFSAKVAVAGLPAMREAGRLEEALKRLQGVIAELSKRVDAPGLGEAVDRACPKEG